MPQQLYMANVVYSTSFSGYFTVYESTIQGAAIQAVNRHDANGMVFLANGASRYAGNTVSGLPNLYAKAGLPVLVYVRDTSANQTWLCNVGIISANVGTVATYNVAYANNVLVTN